MAGGSGGALDRSLFAVRDAAGVPVGVAFLVASDIAVTCAHVVSRVLDGTEAAEGAMLVLDQPLAVKGRGRRHTARLARLLPEQAGGAGDIAILQLAETPADARVVRLVDAENLWGHSVRTFGFPARRALGVWHEGLLRDRQGAGWIQVDAAGSAGYPIAPGFSGAPVWDDDLAGVVGMVVAADTSAASAGYVIPTEWLLEAWPDLRMDAIPPSPYRGLLPFRDVDQKFFFGRQTQSGELADQVSRQPVITVIGASGCGKTSLVQAGLAPQLRARRAAVAVMRAGDGSAPINALAAALGPLLEPGRSETEQLSQQPALANLITEQGLLDVLARVLVVTGTQQLVIVLDQAEQLLEQPPGTVDALLRVLFPEEPPAQLRVVLTLRADYLDAALRHARLAGPLSQGSYLLSAMTSDQINEAVTRPIERVPGVDFEPGLAARIVADAGSDAGVLPLLGNILTMLWQRQQRGVVTHQAYDELGQLSGSLAQYAKEVWAGIPQAEHDTARRLFLALVRISRDGRRSSRRAATEEQLGQQGWLLAQRLATTRILVAGRDAEDRPTVELAHDTLIDRWARLRDWVDDHRDFLIWRDELRDDHARWQRAGRTAELLLRGDPLQAARAWLARQPVDLTAAEQDFITASVRGQRSAGRRRQVLVAVFAGVLVLALVAIVLAVIRDRAVRAEQAVAASRAFAASSNSFIRTDQARAALLALTAYRESPTGEARQALFRSYLDTLGTEAVLSGWPGDFRDADITPDGRVVVVLSDVLGGSDDRYLTLWTRQPGKPLRATRLTADPGSSFVGVTNHGDAVLLAGSFGIVRFDVATGQRRNIVGPPGKIVSIAFTADGSAATASVDGEDVPQRIVAWDLRTGRVVAERPGPPATNLPPVELRLAPDLHSLVVEYQVAGRQASEKGLHRAEVWDMLSGQTRLLEDRLDYMKVTSGGVLVSCMTLPLTDSGFQVSVIARRVADGTEIARAKIPESCFEFSTNRLGTAVAVSGGGGSLRIFDISSGGSRSILAGASESSVSMGEFTDERGGDLLLVRNFVGTMEIVSLRSNSITDRITGTGTTKLTPNGQLLVSVSADERQLQVTSPEKGNRIAVAPRPVLSRGPKYFASTVFSRDSSLLAHRVSADRVMVYRLPTLEVASEIVTPLANADTDFGDLFFNGAGRLFTQIGSEVTCWDPRTGASTCHLDLAKLGLLPAGGIPQVSPLDDPNQLLVVVPGKTTVLTIDMSTGREVSSFEVGADVARAGRQRNSPYLVVSRKNSAIELWDVDKRRKVLGPLPEADPPPFGFATSLQQVGSLMIGTQNRVAVWRVGSETAEYSLELPEQWKGVDASRDGSRLAATTGDAAGTTVVVDLRPEEWAKQVCRIVAGRELTSADVVGLPASSQTGPLCPQ